MIVGNSEESRETAGGFAAAGFAAAGFAVSVSRGLDVFNVGLADALGARRRLRARRVAAAQFVTAREGGRRDARRHDGAARGSIDSEVRPHGVAHQAAGVVRQHPVVPGAAVMLAIALISVSYTHLTLPTKA